MAESTSPKTETITKPRTRVHLDLSYIYTAAGILKCAQIVLSLLGLISISSTHLRFLARGEWFTSVSVGGFGFSGLMLILYLYHVTDKFQCMPWTVIEFIFCLLWSVFYLVAASLTANWGRIDEAMAAAAFFGFVAMISYLADAFLKYQEVGMKFPVGRLCSASPA